MLSQLQYIIGGVLLVALLSLGAARLPLFQKDLRRSISFGVSFLGLLTTVLSVQVLGTGFGLREAALKAAEPALVSQWNGLILGAIVLLLVSALAFFFAMGVFIWSLLPAGHAPTPQRAASMLNAWGGGFESPPQTLNPVDDR